MTLRGLLVLLVASVASAAAWANKPGLVTVAPTAAFPAFLSLTAQENESPSCPRTIINGQVRVTATLDDGGGAENFGINAWDDGVFRTGVPFSVPVGATAIYDFQLIYAFDIQEGASGVGVYLENMVGPSAGITWAANGSLNGTMTTACPPVGNTITLVSLRDPNVPIPALAPAVLGLLAALVGLLGLRAQRRRS